MAWTGPAPGRWRALVSSQVRRPASSEAGRRGGERVVEPGFERGEPRLDRVRRREVDGAHVGAPAALRRDRVEDRPVGRRLRADDDPRSFREQQGAEAGGIGDDADRRCRAARRRLGRRTVDGEHEPGRPRGRHGRRREGGGDGRVRDATGRPRARGSAASVNAPFGAAVTTIGERLPRQGCMAADPLPVLGEVAPGQRGRAEIGHLRQTVRSADTSVAGTSARSAAMAKGDDPAVPDGHAPRIRIPAADALAKAERKAAKVARKAAKRERELAEAAAAQASQKAAKAAKKAPRPPSGSGSRRRPPPTGHGRRPPRLRRRPPSPTAEGRCRGRAPSQSPRSAPRPRHGRPRSRHGGEGRRAGEG